MSASDATFPKLLRGLATKNPDQTALQEKRYGIWQPMSWSTYAARVQDFAHGLAALGVERGQIVAVLGDNRPEWLIAELAAQSIGAAVVGIYPTSIGEELLHILTLAQVKVVVAEDQEQVDKLLKLRAEAAAAAVDPSAATSAPFADMPPLLTEATPATAATRGTRARVGRHAPRLARRAGRPRHVLGHRRHLHDLRNDEPSQAG